MLNVGNKAPDFKIKLVNGMTFHLNTTLKNSSVLINFIRGTWCEECTNHLKRVEEWKDKLNRKARSVTTLIIAVEEDIKLKKWAELNKSSYLMGSDEKGAIAQSFGFMVPEDAYSKPGIILIDSDGMIRIISSDLHESRIEVENTLELK